MSEPASRQAFITVTVTVKPPPSPGAAYPVTLFAPPGTEQAGQMALDLAVLQTLAEPETYGRALGRALFGAEALGPAFREALAAAHQARTGLRVRLRLDDETLQGLAWERLCYRAGQAWLPLGVSAQTPYARFFATPEWDQPQPVHARPVCLLLVIASPVDLASRAGLDPIAPEEGGALKALFAGLGQVRLITLESGTGRPPTLANLRAALQEGVDFVHFVCHGVRKQAGTAIYLENDRGGTQAVTTAALARALRCARPPVFCFLTACESAARAAHDAFLPLGPELVRSGGVAAVLAMTGRVGFETARRFTSTFYTRLFRHGLADLAVNEARAQVQEQWDWGAPVLFSRLEENRLLDRAPEVIDGLRNHLEPPLRVDAWTAEQKRRLVDALMRCTTMRTGEARNLLVDQLAESIRSRVARGRSMQIDVANIVETCMNYSEGMTALVDTLRWMEGDSLPVQQVAQMVRGEEDRDIGHL